MEPADIAKEANERTLHNGHKPADAAHVRMYVSEALAMHKEVSETIMECVAEHDAQGRFQCDDGDLPPRSGDSRDHATQEAENEGLCAVWDIVEVRVLRELPG
jgi:hypothetical protein